VQKAVDYFNPGQIQDSRSIDEDNDKSLSSIEKHQDDDNDEEEERQCFEGCNMQMHKVQMTYHNSSMQEPQGPVFTNTKVLNIQENKFTPEHEVDS